MNALQDLTNRLDELEVKGVKMADAAFDAGYGEGRKRGTTWGIFIGAAIAWGSYLVGWLLFRGL